MFDSSSERRDSDCTTLTHRTKGSVNHHFRQKTKKTKQSKTKAGKGVIQHECAGFKNAAKRFGPAARVGEGLALLSVDSNRFRFSLL